MGVEDVPWPERVLAVRADPLEIVNVHSPISPKPGLVKVLTHEAVFRHLATGAGPRIVLGDLNTPRREHADGTVGRSPVSATGACARTAASAGTRPSPP